ncbi:MAG: DinB family protein [Capsulimonadaceae bacterium]
MSNFPDYARVRLLASMAGAPAVLRTLARQVPGGQWDYTADPERFTLRQIVAHLADWETILIERVMRIIDEHQPTLERTSPGERAESMGYATWDPANSIRDFARRRASLVDLLGGLGTGYWRRCGVMRDVGKFSLVDQAVMIAGHDGYHCRQFAEWLKHLREEP